MKKITALFTALYLGTVLLYASDPCEGLWKSIDDKTGKITAVWNIYQEGGKLYGKIEAVVDHPQDVVSPYCKESYKGFPVAGKVNQMKTVGTPWIFNLTKDADGTWKNGNIIDPGSGKMYGCVIKHLNAGEQNKKFTAKTETLAMAGTVGPIQVFQYWTKASDADIKKIRDEFPPLN